MDRRKRAGQPPDGCAAGCYDGAVFATGHGLTRISDEELRTLLRAAYHGKLRYPLRRSELLAQGLGNLADRAEALLGLDERGLRTVVACVLAEREAARRRATPNGRSAGPGAEAKP